MTTSMNDDLLELRFRQQDETAKKVDEIHKIVIELNARFNGGPGSWSSCIQHANSLTELKSKVDGIEKRVLPIVGGLSVITIVISLFGPHIVNLLLKKP